jgi:hypothetical protein
MLKMFLSPNALLQRMGLLFVLAVSQRISRAIASCGLAASADLKILFGRAVHATLPDFTSLVRLRALYIDMAAGRGEDPAVEGMDVDGAEEEEKEEEEEGGEAGRREKGAYLLTLVHEVMEAFIGICPGTLLGNFDALKLLDDLVPWPSSQTTVQAVAALNESVDQ